MDKANDPSEDVQLMEAMLREMEAFAKGQIRLPQLVSELGAGIEALAHNEPDLAAALKEPWWVLEELNALALDEGKVGPHEEHRANVERALSRMVSCVREVLHAR